MMMMITDFIQRRSQVISIFLTHSHEQIQILKTFWLKIIRKNSKNTPIFLSNLVPWPKSQETGYEIVTFLISVFGQRFLNSCPDLTLSFGVAWKFITAKQVALMKLKTYENFTWYKMPKKKTGARKKAEKQKERQRGIRASRERPITEYFCNVIMVSLWTMWLSIAITIRFRKFDL